PKSRDWAYTDSTVVKEWLIDTGCGNDLLSKRDVASVNRLRQEGQATSCVPHSEWFYNDQQRSVDPYTRTGR
ncbi:MAG: hypothetical protein ACKPKO_18785, partial [Candidatus Fonsibacter sp.]